MPAPAQIITHPSFIEPGHIMPYAQASGAFDAVAGGLPQVKLGEGDLLVYARRLDIRTRIAGGQMAYNQLPSIAITPSYISTPTALMRVRAEWDHHDENSYARQGINLPDAMRYGTLQAHAQFVRNALLYGINAANGEGLLNAAGATAVNVPADTNGHSTVTTIDSGQFIQFLLQFVQALKTRTNQLGMPRKIVIVAPQRVLGQFEFGVVQLTEYQRPGAGSATGRSELEQILKDNKDSLLWAYDDTLIGKGSGGTDAILIVMPEVERPVGPTGWNTNEFAALMPSLDACTIMYTDMAAPREIYAPLTAGGTDMVSERRITAGWGIRPESITVASIAYP